MKDCLLQTIKQLPMTPGCYIFSAADRSVLYVGKSKHIRSRVQQYFQSRDTHPPKIRKLVRLITEINYINADTEIDALLLEYRLIKQYRPPFNAQMKKDRHPPFIQINTTYERPGLSIVYEPTPGVPCYGHFSSTWDAEDALTLLNKVWHTPLCGKAFFDHLIDRPIGNKKVITEANRTIDRPIGNKKVITEANRTIDRPCLNYHMGRCVGPCVHDFDEKAYRHTLQEVDLFLQGRNPKALNGLKRAMRQAAEELAFEQAARLRDQYNALTALTKRLKTKNTGYAGKRICAFIKGYHEEVFLLLYIDDGKVLTRMRFPSGQDWPGVLLSAFVDKVTRREWDMEPDAGLAAAVAVVHARKRFVDISHVRKASVLLRQLTEAFPSFYTL